MMGGTEQRRYPRLKPPPGTTLTLTPLDQSAPDGNMAARIIDVSAVGACLETKGRLREGASLKVELVLAGPRGGKTLTRGTVRWTQVLEAGGAHAFVAGLEFEAVIESLAGTAGESSILDILLTLRVAVAQLRLYHKESPQVLKVVSDAFQSIHAYLEGAESLTLSKTPKGLLVNGRPMLGGGTVVESLEKATLALMADVQIKSISFKKGLAMEELLTFLHALTRKFWDVKDGKEINRRLREERVLQISVDEITYVALGAGDIVIEDAARKLTGGETELSKVMENFEALIDSTSSNQLASEARLQIMKRMLEKDPNLLKKMGEYGYAFGAGSAGGPGGGTGSGGGGEAAGGGAGSAAEASGGGSGTGSGAPPGWVPPPGVRDLSLIQEGLLKFEKAREAVGDLARLILEVPPSCQPTLRSVGMAIIHGFRHNPKLAALMETVLNGGAAQLAEAGAGSSEPAAVLREAAILSMLDDEKLRTLAEEGATLLEELTALDRPDLVQEILNCPGNYLGDRSAKRRAAACKVLSALRRAYEASASEELQSLEIGIRSALDQERDPIVYPLLAEVGAFLADLQIRRGGLDRGREIVELLHKHYKIKDPSFVRRGEMAYSALEKIASGAGVAGLAQKAREGDPAAGVIFESLGAAATRFFIGQIRAAPDAATRLNLAGFVARAGAGAASVLLEEIQKTQTPSDILHLIDVLPHAMPPDMVELALAGLLRHSATAVRKRAAHLATEQAYPRAGAALLDALAAEEDPGLRLVYVEGLGRLKAKAAVDALEGLAESRQSSDELRAAACTALGRIGETRSVALLIRVSTKGEKGLAGMLRSIPVPVRAAAVRALAGFPASKEAREALRKAQEDKEAMVRSAAQQARYAPIYEAFGSLAQGVQIVSGAADLGARSERVAGFLSEISFEQVCRWIGKHEKVGLFSARLGSATGTVAFDAGLVINADYEGRRDRDAFAAIARRSDGVFLFQGGVATTDRRILVPVESLLQEIARGKVS